MPAASFKMETTAINAPELAQSLVESAAKKAGVPMARLVSAGMAAELARDAQEIVRLFPGANTQEGYDRTLQKLLEMGARQRVEGYAEGIRKLGPVVPRRVVGEL